MDRRQNILVIKLGALGDFIQALGPMKAIRKHHPHDKITLLTTKPFVKLAEKTGYFDDIWIDDRPKWFHIKQWLDLRKKFNKGTFCRVYDLQNNDRTSFYFKLFSPKPEWVGIASGASHRNTSPERTKGQAFDGHIQTLKLAGIENIEIDPMDWIDEDIDVFDLSRPYVLIVPGSAPSRPEKRWPSYYYGQLCLDLQEKGYQPVLIGTEDERDVTAQIKQICAEAYDLTGKTTLFQIIALARGAFGSVGNDTGPMHMIAPTGCPSLVLFSKGSDPVRHAPKGKKVISLQRETLDDLSVDEVIQAFLDLGADTSLLRLNQVLGK